MSFSDALYGNDGMRWCSDKKLTPSIRLFSNALVFRQDALYVIDLCKKKKKTAIDLTTILYSKPNKYITSQIIM